MNYNPFSFISCQEDALVLAGCISHGLDADVIKKSGDLFATARAMLLDACVCLLYRQGGDSMNMQGLVDLLQNDISHNEDQGPRSRLPMTRSRPTVRLSMRILG